VGQVHMKTLKLSARLLCSGAVILFATEGAMAAQSGSSGSGALEFVVVTGTRQQAVNTKREAPNVKDVQSLESIRELPDVNAAEALERVPGISLETDSGEGRFINIRGMDADLNGTTYDGVRLTASNPSSPQGGGRAVAFDAFPSGILGGIEVMKSLTPEMDAEGLGGVVNILPRALPSGKQWMVDAGAGSGLEPLRGNPVWQGDVTAAARSGLFMDDDRITILASYAYHEDWRGIDDIEEDYLNDPAQPPKTFDDVQYRWYRYHRTRQGYGGSVTFDITDDTQVYLRGIHAGYNEVANKQRLQLNGLGNVTAIAADGTFSVNKVQPREALTFTSEDIGNDMVELGGSTVFSGGVKADIRGSWTRGSDVVPLGGGFTWKGPKNVTLNYNNNDPRFPSYHVTNGIDLTNPAIYTAAGFSGSNSLNQNSDEEWAGKGDVDFPWAPFSDSGDLKVGLSARLRTRQASASSADYSSTLGYDAFSDPTMDRIYYNGNYNIGAATLFNKLLTLPQGPQAVDPTAFEDDNENVYAAYAQYGATFGDFYALLGVRVEKTQATYRANQIDDLGNISPSVNKQNYTDVFPDLNLKYQLWDDVVLRAAYTTGIARPGFNQITAATSVDTTNDIVSRGNPSLKPTKGQSVDLSAEYYDPDGGIASLALFYKSFTNYIIPTVQLNVPTFITATGIVLNNVEIDSFANIGGATADGIEIGYTKQFTFLPEGWDGLGFDGNVTFVGSRGQIRVGERSTLPQTSPINYNAAIFYQKGPFNLRFAANYVSRNIFSVSSDASTDVYSQPRLRIDFGGSYMITDEIEYYLDVKNLSNTKLEFTQTANKNFPIQREFYDATYLTGLRIKLGE
jgi:TonB-dependent receptor